MPSHNTGVVLVRFWVSTFTSWGMAGALAKLASQLMLSAVFFRINVQFRTQSNVAVIFFFYDCCKIFNAFYGIFFITGLPTKASIKLCVFQMYYSLNF